jgi:hypothetical protein
LLKTWEVSNVVRNQWKQHAKILNDDYCINIQDHGKLWSQHVLEIQLLETTNDVQKVWLVVGNFSRGLAHCYLNWTQRIQECLVQ